MNIGKNQYIIKDGFYNVEKIKKDLTVFTGRSI